MKCLLSLVLMTLLAADAQPVRCEAAPASQASPPTESAAHARPNVVFILADDLGWPDLGCYGSTFYETPHIDRLAQRGVRFTQAYAASPLCSPTRASILTGLHPARIGITLPNCHLPKQVLHASLASWGQPISKCLYVESATRLNTDYITLAEMLKQAGYATGHFGKWHLGPEPYSPLQQGFDVDIPHWPGPGPAGCYVAPWKSPAFKLSAQPGDHIENLMTTEAIKFIQANKQRPFYLNYWAFSVHGPYDSKKALIEQYRAKAIALPRNNPQRNALYAAMVQCLDDAVGQLTQALEDAGIAERTIIVFFSDNGGVHWAHPEYHKDKTEWSDIPITSNAPLRGGKATIYEGGTREPCIVIWPDITQAGVTTNTIVQSTDFAPTLMEMLGVRPPPDLSFDGKSFVAALRGRPHDRGPTFCHFPHHVPLFGRVQETIPSTYVRLGDWKLIRFYCDNQDRSDRYELYNLMEDIGEEHNLAGQMPAKVKAMDLLIDQFLRNSGAIVPKPNPAYRPGGQSKTAKAPTSSATAPR